MAGDKLKNWAGNLEYSTENLYSANSMEQAQDFVKKQSQLKVLGTRHCFNNIADSKYNLLSLAVDGQGNCSGPRGAHRDRRGGHQLWSVGPVSRRQGLCAS